MYSLPSTSQTRAPSARDTTYGRPPTDENARIDELTPPGIAATDRANTASLSARPAPTHSAGVQPAGSQRAGSQYGIIASPQRPRQTTGSHTTGSRPLRP